MSSSNMLVNEKHVLFFVIQFGEGTSKRDECDRTWEKTAVFCP